jgi:hypothetical protein
VAQHDYIIANQSGAAFRADLNNGLAAIVSQNSGATQPSTTYAYQWWADTTTGLLKIRNAANNAWITVGTLADTNFGLLPAAGGTMTGDLTLNAQSDLRLADSDSSNWVALQAPATVTSNVTWTLPATDGTADQTLATNGTGTLAWGTRSRLVQETAVNPTSGTSVPFTGIPSWAKRITVSLVNISTNGTSAEVIQIGDSGGYATTGYEAVCSYIIAATPAISAGAGGVFNSQGFVLMGQTASTATNQLSGRVVLDLVGTTGGLNYWACSGVIGRQDAGTYFQKFVAGHKGLSGTLDRIRLTTLTGTATFDGGLVNIIYEG